MLTTACGDMPPIVDSKVGTDDGARKLLGIEAAWRSLPSRLRVVFLYRELFTNRRQSIQNVAKERRYSFVGSLDFFCLPSGEQRRCIVSGESCFPQRLYRLVGNLLQINLKFLRFLL